MFLGWGSGESVITPPNISGNEAVLFVQSVDAPPEEFDFLRMAPFVKIWNLLN